MWRKSCQLVHNSNWVHYDWLSRSKGELVHLAEQPKLPVWIAHICNGGWVHPKHFPLQLGAMQGRVVKPLRGQHANLVAIELKQAMLGEAPIPEADPLVRGLIQVNPLPGWQESGQAQKTAMQRVAAKVSQEPLITQ